ncbi:MAG: hypothetical protein QW350_05355 [Candidatus Aenigmatarchaeota archaeon]
MSLLQNNTIIYLKCINTNEIFTNYQQGKYKNFDIKELATKNPISPPKIKFLPEYSNLRDSSIYVFRDRNNYQQKVYSTNHKIPKRCFWCRKEFSSEPIGIPIHLVTLTNKDTFEKTYIFYMDQIGYCSFECCFSGLKQDKQNVFSNSEYYLKFLFYLTTGKRGLKEAPHWTLIEEFENDPNLTFHEYKSIGYIQIYPVFQEFLEYRHEQTENQSESSSSSQNHLPVLDNQ